ncbi:pH-response regulator protein palA/rim20 [Tulasnella sp. 403]|nr:pH-response regulator protein palA/rim20 [Tulasnella sp. 403]
MSNQLTIPFKSSHPANISEAARQYIQDHHPETHPDAFRFDIAEWEKLRKAATTLSVHVSKIEILLKYHAQLAFILTKLPPDIGLGFTYDPTFKSPGAGPLTLSNICYERVNILYNLASLYCQLARSQDKENGEGVKVATNHFANAAGTLMYLLDSALPALEASLGRSLPMDLSRSFFLSLQWLMLAQAQECAWNKARIDNMKSGIMARIAVKVAAFYQSAIEAIERSSPPVLNAFPADWKAHLEIKRLHFEAVAQYRKSMDENAAGKYGEEVARLQLARDNAKTGYDLARKSRGVAKQVKDNVEVLLDNMEKELARATRDNDLIYLKDVPSSSELPAIQGVDVAKVIVPSGLNEPRSVLDQSDSVPLFGDLVAHGARAAIELYKDRRTNWIKEEILDFQRQLDAQASRLLQELHLPAALEAVDKNVGLPPSLLTKAEEVQNEGGGKRISQMMADLETLRAPLEAIIEEAFDILDAEAEEDTEMREVYSQYDVWQRTPSHEANSELTERATRYQDALRKAAQSDQEVRDKWSQWEQIVAILCKPEAEIEKMVPSTTLKDQVRHTSTGSHTQKAAQILRRHLEDLKEIRTARADLMGRVNRVALADDIQARVVREAISMERWVEVKPAMFEDTIASELQKYERYRELLGKSKEEQEQLLPKIERANAEFIQSRKESPLVKEREQAIHTLAQAYDQYRDTITNLSDGIQFYNQMTSAANQLREDCKNWVDTRRAEVKWLTDSLMAIPQVTTTPVSVPESPPYSSPQTAVAQPSSSPLSSSAQIPSGLGQTQNPVPDAMPSRGTNTSAPTSGWRPRSKLVQQALAAVPEPSSGDTQPQATSDEAWSTLAAAVPTPWRQPVVARELNEAEWEDTPSRPARVAIPELSNADIWEDTVLPPASPMAKGKTPAKGKTLKKQSTSTNPESPAPQRTSRSRASRLPA